MQMWLEGQNLHLENIKFQGKYQRTPECELATVFKTWFITTPPLSHAKKIWQKEKNNKWSTSWHKVKYPCPHSSSANLRLRNSYKAILLKKGALSHVCAPLPFQSSSIQVLGWWTYLLVAFPVSSILWVLQWLTYLGIIVLHSTDYYPHTNESWPTNGASLPWWITWLNEMTTNRIFYCLLLFNFNFSQLPRLQLMETPISK